MRYLATSTPYNDPRTRQTPWTGHGVGNATERVSGERGARDG